MPQEGTAPGHEGVAGGGRGLRRRPHLLILTSSPGSLVTHPSALLTVAVQSPGSDKPCLPLHFLCHCVGRPRRPDNVHRNVSSSRPPCTWSSGQARGVGPSRAASALPGTCHVIGGALLAEPVWAGPLVRAGPGAATADSKGTPPCGPDRVQHRR